LGFEDVVISELNTIDGIIEVCGTFGAYDILTRWNLVKLKHYVRQLHEK